MKDATRDMNIKGTSGDVSDGNEEYDTGTCRKGGTYLKKKVAENLMGSCRTILWKVELLSDDHRF